MNYEIRITNIFNKWQKSIKDPKVRKAIANRLHRVKLGNLGDVKSVGDGVSEMRIFTGKGLRIYFTIRRQTVIILLNGGDKSNQEKDIKNAKKIIKTLEQ